MIIFKDSAAPAPAPTCNIVLPLSGSGATHSAEGSTPGREKIQDTASSELAPTAAARGLDPHALSKPDKGAPPSINSSKVATSFESTAACHTVDPEGVLYPRSSSGTSSRKSERTSTQPPAAAWNKAGQFSRYDRILTDWYRELEAAHAEDEDANDCMGALANALQISPYELNAKLECAHEISEAVRANTYDLIGTSKGIRLSNWATAYISFLKEAQTCHLHYQLSNEGSTGQTPSHIFEDWVVDVYAVNQVSVNSHGDDVTKSSNSIGLLHWYTELEFARHRADVGASDDNDPFSDERENARMAELERIAAMGAEHEQLLHTLITRHDTATKELSGHHHQCDLLCSVASGGMIRREKLEEMYLFLKSNVLSGDDLDSVSNKVYDKMAELDPSGESSNVVDMLLGMHLLEDELIMLKQRIDTILNSDAPGDEDGTNESKGDQRFTAMQTANELSFVNFQDPTAPLSPFAGRKQDDTCSLRAENKDDVNNKGGENKSDVDMDAVLRDKAAAMAFTKEMKEDHRLGLNKLKAVLNKNRALKIGELKTKRKEKEDNGESIIEIERELNATIEELNEEEEGLIKGYKRRCVLETRAVKAKIAQGLSPEKWALTAEEREKAAQDAVKSLRDKYELELNKLLQSQQHDRSKMKQKLMDKILARKRKRAAEDNFASTETADEMLEAAENEAKDLLQDEEARARTEMIRPLLLAMSAAEMMDPVLMTSSTTGDAKGGADDDDGYFGDSSSGDDKATALISQWSKDSVDLSNSYTGAISMLQATINGIGEEANGGGVGVVLNACTVHLQEMNHHVVQWGHGKKDDIEMDRIKNGIMNEFRKKKEALEQSLAQKQDTSSKLLDERRRKKTKNSALTYDTEDDTVQEDDLSNLEDLFQNFDSQSSKDGVDFESKYKKWYTSPGYVGDRIDIGSEWEDVRVGSGSVGGGSGYQFSVPKRGFHLPPMEEDSGSGSSVQKILTGKGIKAQDTASRVEMWMQQRNINKDKKNDILESHNVHQGNLLDGLSTEMSQQKSKLKERLQQMKAKKQQKSTASFAQSKGADGDWEQEEIRVEEEKLQRLETNYNNIVDMLADASSEDLQRIGLTRLKDLLENSEGKAMKLQDDGDMKLHDLESWDEAERRRQEQKASQQSSRNMLHAQAKEISDQYSEENKKLTLKMNLEKARQKQNLQRKLLERKRNMTSSSNVGGGGDSK